MAEKTAPATEDAAQPGAAAPDPQPEKAAEAADAHATGDDRVEALAAEAADLKNKLLRTLAEMENLRRRTEREIGDARQYAVANFARDMLTVGDNLRRAIDAVPAELRDGRDPALSALIEGVAVTEKGMQQSLAKHGVRQIEAKGEKFDPGMHQAMYEVETGDVSPGTVAEEIQAGYAIGERVLRPALVAVAKRAKTEPSDSPEGAPDEAESDPGPQAA